MEYPDLEFVRWAKTAAIKSGRLNMWQKDKAFSGGVVDPELTDPMYAYNRETHQFFKSEKNNNTTNLPYYPGSRSWRHVDESAYWDGLTEPEIIVSVSKGDVAIRPLYHYFAEEPLPLPPPLPEVVFFDTFVDEKE